MRDREPSIKRGLPIRIWIRIRIFGLPGSLVPYQTPVNLLFRYIILFQIQFGQNNCFIFYFACHKMLKSGKKLNTNLVYSKFIRHIKVGSGSEYSKPDQDPKKQDRIRNTRKKQFRITDIYRERLGISSDIQSNVSYFASCRQLRPVYLHSIKYPAILHSVIMETVQLKTYCIIFIG